MSDLHAITPRRSFIGRLAGGATALVAASAATGPALAATPDGTLAQGEEWLGKLHGRYRQVFDAVSFNDGFPLIYALNWTNTMKETYKVGNDEVCAVIGLRHFGIGPAFSDIIWQKYKLGEFLKINDPKTKAPATRNFANSTAAGDLMMPQAAIGAQIANGAVVTVCNLATSVLSGATARAAGLNITPEAAYAEWKANLLPGCYLAPSGVLAVHRLQRVGDCSYCFAG